MDLSLSTKIISLLNNLGIKGSFFLRKVNRGNKIIHVFNLLAIFYYIGLCNYSRNIIVEKGFLLKKTKILSKAFNFFMHVALIVGANKILFFEGDN
jgi:hypothetical protein